MSKKPKYIHLIRHGQSEGNVDHEIYKDKPDFILNLTPLGRQQAETTGIGLKYILGGRPSQVYVSPMWRALETQQLLCKHIPVQDVKVDARLREQCFGHRPGMPYDDVAEAERLNYSIFWYRYNNGESGADVYDRIASFIETMFRNAQSDDAPEDVVIVFHGMAMRIFLMALFNWTVEQMETTKNPTNGQLVCLEYDEQKDKYNIINPLGTVEVNTKYHYDYNKNV